MQPLHNMFYFAYGSNMSSRRLKARVPSAKFICFATLRQHELVFHKISQDGSGKCDVYFTGSDRDAVIGVIFEIDEREKPALDLIEGLGNGYEQKPVELVTRSGEMTQAYTYYATHIDPTLRPYHWYKQHVLRGAEEFGLPEKYIDGIRIIESLTDPDSERHVRELAIYA